MPTINDVCKAVRKGDLRELKRLTSGSHGIDLNQTDEWFEPGWWGTTINSDGLFGTYQKYGSSVPSKYLGPMTPLIIAATYAHYDCVEYLVNLGVSLDILGGRRKDYTALDCATSFGRKANLENANRIIVLLESRSAKKHQYYVIPNIAEALGIRGLQAFVAVASIAEKKAVDEISSMIKKEAKRVAKESIQKYAVGGSALAVGVAGGLVYYGFFKTKPSPSAVLPYNSNNEMKSIGISRK